MTKYRFNDLPTAEQIHQDRMKDPAYRAEWERTAVARGIAELVIQYRAKHAISQTELSRRIGVSQSQVARLEAGEHIPTIPSLIRLAQVLDLEIVIDVAPIGRKRRLVTEQSTSTGFATTANENTSVLVAAA